jgi:hypothetical protein
MVHAMMAFYGFSLYVQLQVFLYDAVRILHVAIASAEFSCMRNDVMLALRATVHGSKRRMWAVQMFSATGDVTRCRVQMRKLLPILHTATSQRRELIWVRSRNYAPVVIRSDAISVIRSI